MPPNDLPFNFTPGEYNGPGSADGLITALRADGKTTLDIFGAEDTARLLSALERNDLIKQDFGVRAVHTMLDKLPKRLRDIVLYNIGLQGNPRKSSLIQQIQFAPPGSFAVNFTGAIALAGLLEGDEEFKRKKQKFIDHLLDEVQRLREYFLLYHSVYAKLNEVEEAVDEALAEIEDKEGSGDMLQAGYTDATDRKEELEEIKEKTQAYRQELEANHAPSETRLKEINEKLDQKVEKVKNASPALQHTQGKPKQSKPKSNSNKSTPQSQTAFTDPSLDPDNPFGQPTTSNTPSQHSPSITDNQAHHHQGNNADSSSGTQSSSRHQGDGYQGGSTQGGEKTGESTDGGNRSSQTTAPTPS
ncbi:MAG: hypothetical protein KDJ75_01550 [Alphaproteobacteria bacterium]|nr:hypothetical protein [Alphaproteobacteria bacterium]